VSLGLDQFEFSRACDGPRAAGDAQLAIDVVGVGFDCADTDVSS
jgi:hypothetical protein